MMANKAMLQASIAQIMVALIFLLFTPLAQADPPEEHSKGALRHALVYEHRQYQFPPRKRRGSQGPRYCTRKGLLRRRRSILSLRSAGDRERGATTR